MLRTRLIHAAYQAHGGGRSPEAMSLQDLALLAATLEIFHDSAQVHGDLVDRADTRRGRDAIAKHLEKRHRAEGWLGDPVHFGRSLALVTGDFGLLSAERYLHVAVSRVSAAKRREYMIGLHETTRWEVVLGQYLELVGSRLADMPAPDELVEQALEVVRLRSSRYAAATPLGLGAAAAGASFEDCQVMLDFGLPLGEASHLRDEQLGATGDPAETGRPAGGDLLEGKRTVLVGLTLQRLDPRNREAFIRALQRGDAPLADERVLYLRGLIISSGALQAHEALIQAKANQAFEALERARLEQADKDRLAKVALEVVNRRV